MREELLLWRFSMDLGATAEAVPAAELAISVSGASRLSGRPVVEAFGLGMHTE